MRRLLSLMATLTFIACGGQVVFSEPEGAVADDGQCHALCVCLDGSVALAETPLNQNNSCFNACDDACSTRGGVRHSLGALEGVGSIAFCDELCARVDAAGCQMRCEDLLGPCQPSAPEACGTDVAETLECLATRAEVVCDGPVIRLDGCEAEYVGSCGVP